MTSILSVVDILGSSGTGAPATITNQQVSPFDPKQLITGAGGFWRADVGVTQSSGSVSAWADRAVYRNDLTVVSSTAPTWSATGWLSSFAGVTFVRASSTFIANTSLQFSNSVGSAFVLLSVTATDALNGGWLSFVGTSGNQDATATNSFTLLNGGAAGSPSFGVDQANTGFGGNSMTTNTPFLLGVTMDETNITPWFNGTGIGSADTNAIGGASPAIVLGNRYRGSVGGGAMDGTIAFAGITQRILSQTDWNNLKTWSNANWGTSF